MFSEELDGAALDASAVSTEPVGTGVGLLAEGEPVALGLSAAGEGVLEVLAELEELLDSGACGFSAAVLEPEQPAKTRAALATRVVKRDFFTRTTPLESWGINTLIVCDPCHGQAKFPSATLICVLAFASSVSP
ncbi:hypothetical protein GCM10007359_07880 [Rothia aerolata]|uniref:Uncharacterized protein n=1 Tax=Rothia aerolata TaxID=1812262 RepID=A0A917IS55_9MICC|nr:hypothetical protein GCM10007359_07880 [Rothia aerolata]